MTKDEANRMRDDLKVWMWQGWDRAIFEDDMWVRTSIVLEIIDEFFDSASR